MADNGNLYPVFKPAIIEAMHHLISKATVITPNYTEACLLLDVPYKEEIPTTKKITTWCQKLSALGPSKIVITSVPASNDEIKNISYDSMQSPHTLLHHQEPDDVGKKYPNNRPSYSVYGLVNPAKLYVISPQYKHIAFVAVPIRTF